MNQKKDRKRLNPAKTQLLPQSAQAAALDLFDTLWSQLQQPRFPEPCWVCHHCRGILQASVETVALSCPMCRRPMEYHGPARPFQAPTEAIEIKAEDVTHARIEGPEPKK